MKVIDLHCDTLSELRHAAQRGESVGIARNDLHIDLEKLRKGDYMLQCFALYTNMKRDGDTLVAALEMADIFRGIMAAHPEKIGQVKTWADLEANRAAGRLSGMLTIEEGDCCRANPAVLRTFYELGVRIMTLTWNFENDLAWPNLLPDLFGKVDTTKPNTTKGLKEMGFEFVAEMERLGIIVDVSHLSDAGFWDISRCATRPFIASHSNARSVCGHVRNLTDEMLRAIAERGGVTGINYCPPFVDPTGEKHSTVAYLADHIEHIRQVGGVDMIALGSDFDGIGGELEMGDCSCLPMLEAELRRRHFSEDEIEKIFHGNALRVLKEFLPAE